MLDDYPTPRADLTQQNKALIVQCAEIFNNKAHYSDSSFAYMYIMYSTLPAALQTTSLINLSYPGEITLTLIRALYTMLRMHILKDKKDALTSL